MSVKPSIPGRSGLICCAFFLGFGLPLSAQAHRAWILPSSMVISAKEAWITVDAAVGNSIFQFDHVPMRLSNLKIIAPDGTQVAPENVLTGRLRSVFDMHLTQGGTYRLAVVNDGLSASYQEKGVAKRWRGSADAFRKEVPANVEGLKVVESISRIEAFVTVGRPGGSALGPDKRGIALQALTHPNDLVQGEPARLQFLVDGKPGEKLEISLVPEGGRYRERSGELRLVTDAEGKVEIDWPQPGRYFMEVQLEDDKTSFSEAKNRRLSYSATFEVSPP